MKKKKSPINQKNRHCSHWSQRNSWTSAAPQHQWVFDQVTWSRLCRETKCRRTHWFTVVNLVPWKCLFFFFNLLRTASARSCPAWLAHRRTFLACHIFIAYKCRLCYSVYVLLRDCSRALAHQGAVRCVWAFYIDMYFILRHFSQPHFALITCRHRLKYRWRACEVCCFYILLPFTVGSWKRVEMAAWCRLEGFRALYEGVWLSG